VRIGVYLFDGAEELDWAVRGRCSPPGRSSGPTTIEVRPDDRFVDAGEVVTAAGVWAGIDIALHVVARLHSVDRAREVKRYVEYDPAPPV
jgi:hypothetical protein